VTTGVETGADGVRWDLSPLAPGEDAMKARLDSAVADASAFVERWPADSLPAIEPVDLATLLGELASLRASREEGRVWTMLLNWSDGENPAVLDVQAWVNDRLPRIEEAIRHFELAWLAVSDERAQVLAEDDAVAADRHYLIASRRFGPYSLSAAEERVLAARDASAASAWKTLRDRTLGGVVARFDDGSGEREWPLAELRAVGRMNPDRDVRRRANEACSDVVDPVLPVVAQCLDALVGDRLAVDRLRGYEDPMAHSLLENEVDTSIVEGLLAASEANVTVAHKWFRLKARLLGLERLDVVDLAAPPFDSPGVSWEDGRRLSVEVFAGLSASLGNEAERFFDEHRIDAEPRRGKPGGAFCEWASTRTPGFVFLNWRGQLPEVSVLAHELGHGTHFALAAKAQTDLSFSPGLTVSEVPSTFGEFLLVERLLGEDDELGRSAIAAMLDQATVAVWMATAFMRFERRVYELRAEGQALNAERLGELCDSALAEFKGDALTDELGVLRQLWALLPHFVHERFYMHSYVSAFLLAAGLLQRAREPGFAERYERFLAGGGSEPPDALFAVLDIDLHDADVWSAGFQVLDGWIERLA
jgi:oligoendopeptidase F